MMTPRLLGICVLLSVLAAPAIRAQDLPECGGHGTLTDGACVCTTPLPLAGQLGWVGDNCTTPVFSYALNVPDVAVGTCAGQAAAPDGLPCNVLAEGLFASRCFAVDISDLHSGAANYVALLFTNTHSNATLRVRGYLTDFGASPVVTPHWSLPFTFTAALEPGGAPARYSLSRHLLDGTTRNGLYVCYINGHSGDQATFGLKIAASTCPLKVLPGGEVSVCSSSPDFARNTTETCPDGWCTCKAPYTKPDVQVDLASGFSDCSATVTALAFDPASGVNATSATVDQAPGRWHYFTIPVVSSDYEVSARAYATAAPADGALSSELELYVRYYQPPGRLPGQYAVTDEQDDWMADQAAGVRLTRDNPAFAQAPLVWSRNIAFAATWYIGVYVNGPSPVSYKLDVFKFNCPNNCSGSGTCALGVCTCSSDAFSGPECARAPATLQLGVRLVVAPRTGGSHAGGFIDTVSLPNVATLLAASRTAALRVTVKTTYGAQSLSEWVWSRPALLIARGGAMTSPLEASSRLPLMEAGKDYVLEVDSAMVDGPDLHLAIRNPFSHPYEVGYTVTVDRVGHCLNECKDQGTCGADGVCACKDGFAGGDCSVALDPAAHVCVPGSRQPEHLADKFATCFHPCKEDGTGFDLTLCSEFECDVAGPDGKALRRQGTADACVTDTCIAGDYIIKADTGDSVCRKQCVCPADGGPCALAAECNADTVQCLDGRVKQGDRCEAAPPAATGCDEGALKPAFKVANGAAFAVCLCAGPDVSSCHFNAPTDKTPKQAVLTCGSGYELQGTTSTELKSNGKAVTSGGKCTLVHSGTSGAGVFFWCIFSIASAVGLAYGAKWAIVRWELHRYGLASGYGDAWDHFTNTNKQPLNSDRW